MDSEKLRRELKHYGRLEKCFVLPDEQFGIFFNFPIIINVRTDFIVIFL